MLYAVPRCRPAARATSLAFSERSDACSTRRTLAAAVTAPTGFPSGTICAISADLVGAARRDRFSSVAGTGAGTVPPTPAREHVTDFARPTQYRAYVINRRQAL